MKKFTALFFAIIGALFFALTGCSKEGFFTEKFYSSGENEIEKVSINVIDRELEICASDDSQIHIYYYDGEKEYLKITVSDNKELTVTLATNKNWTDFIGIKPSKEYRKVQIKIPNNLIFELYASTTNENIKVSTLSTTNIISLNTNGGSIDCKRLSAGDEINLTAKNGDIRGFIAGSWNEFAISCTVKKGNCNLPSFKKGGEKSLSVDCNNGDVNIEFVKQPH